MFDSITKLNRTEPTAKSVASEEQQQINDIAASMSSFQDEALTKAQADLSELQAKSAELADQFLRAKAEAENARRRAEDDVSKARKFAIESFADSLLPVVDSLEAGFCLLYTSPSPRDRQKSRMPSSA